MSKSANGAGDLEARKVFSQLLASGLKVFCEILTLVVWLFLLDFVLQFAHVNKNGHSLPERFQQAAAVFQNPVETAIQMDLRYGMSWGMVDFMPLVIMVGFLFLRVRFGKLLPKIQAAIKAPEASPAPTQSAQSCTTCPAVGKSVPCSLSEISDILQGTHGKARVV